MDYKKEMQRLKKRREDYFPVFEMLLKINSKKIEYDFPLRIEDAKNIALILELIDIEYLERETFVVKKNRRDITALFYNGDYPLTAKGLIEYRRHLHLKRGRYIKLVIGLCFAILIASVYMMIFS